jgi:DNA mismatch endonuclease, patch repair protein
MPLGRGAGQSVFLGPLPTREVGDLDVTLRCVGSLPALLPPPRPSSRAIRSQMQGNRSQDTRPEVAVRSALHRIGLRFRKNRRPAPHLRFRADVVFPTDRVVLFVDGCFWHACPDHGTTPRTNSDYWSAKLERNLARDARNQAILEQEGWLVLRAWEHEDPSDVAARVADAISLRRRDAASAQPRSG